MTAVTAPGAATLLGKRTRTTDDLVAVAVMLVASLIVALPLLADHLEALVDNSAHYAEILDLSHGFGWSDRGLLGFPLDLMQPPVTFGGMALLARLGLPIPFVYGVVAFSGLAAPAIAFYFFARDRVHPAWAAFAGCTLVFYRGSIAVLCGMYSFQLALAAWTLILHRLSRPERTLADVAWLACLVAFVGLTHMFVTIGLAWLLIIHGVWSLIRSPAAGRRLFYDAPATVLGMLAASMYWLPNLMARSGTQLYAEPAKRIIGRLITTGLPIPPPGSGFLARLSFDPSFHLDALPQLFFIGAAAIALPLALRGEDDGPRYGAFVAGIFILLALIQPFTTFQLNGPQPERQMLIAKVAILAASLPWVARVVSRIGAQKRIWATAVVATMAFAFFSSRLIAFYAVPDGSTELRDVEALWTWLGEHKSPSWGRVYVQDTFGINGYKLGQSHILARTSERSGIEQAGAFYGKTPYEKHALEIDFSPENANVVDDVLKAMDFSNSTHLVLCDPRLHARFAEDPRFGSLSTLGRYLVLERKGAVSHYATASGADAVAVHVTRIAPGQLRVESDRSSDAITLSESYHQFWVTSDPDVRLTSDPSGLMLVSGLRSGTAVELTYRPPALPRWLSAGGIVSIALVAAVSLGRWKRHAAPA